jgi:hypothetical protein
VTVEVGPEGCPASAFEGLSKECVVRCTVRT